MNEWVRRLYISTRITSVLKLLNKDTINAWVALAVPNVRLHQRYDALLPCVTIQQSFPGPSITIFAGKWSPDSPQFRAADRLTSQIATIDGIVEEKIACRNYRLLIGLQEYKAVVNNRPAKKIESCE